MSKIFRLLAIPIKNLLCYDVLLIADVAELADALDLGSSSERSEGSSPFIRILNQDHPIPIGCLVLQLLIKFEDANGSTIGGLVI